jgi:hypothetical protein
MQFDTARLRKAVDDAIAAEAQRLLDRCRAGLFYQSAMRQIYEARDPFFPREQVEDDT